MCPAFLYDRVFEQVRARLERNSSLARVVKKKFCTDFRNDAQPAD
jgi:hypothetical protein